MFHMAKPLLITQAQNTIRKGRHGTISIPQSVESRIRNNAYATHGTLAPPLMSIRHEPGTLVEEQSCITVHFAPATSTSTAVLARPKTEASKQLSRLLI
jgi:hypothetical protein